MKRSRIACLVVLWVLPLFATASYAQNSKPSALTVQVPFEFVVGNQTFPAGTYKFQSLLNSVPSQASIDVLEVRSTVGRLYSAIVTDVVGSSEPSHPRLEFIRIGGRAFLSEVWEAGKAAGCRLQIHNAKMQTAESQDNKVTLVASADWR
ncbi:MAG: hypothetical protein ACLPHP_14015 [Candidatus Sulfotelmatobacter sp.]